MSFGARSTMLRASTDPEAIPLLVINSPSQRAQNALFSLYHALILSMRAHRCSARRSFGPPLLLPRFAAPSGATR